MVATVGRYKNVASAPMPGEHLAEEGEARLDRVKLRPVSGSRRAGTPPPRPDEIAPMVAGEILVRHGAVEDPNPALRGRRQRASINVKTDALEREYANGRISDAGYHAGRTYKRVLERSRRPITAAGGWSPGDKVDHADGHEEAIARRIDAAGEAVAMMRDTAPTVGAIAGRVLEMALVDELPLTEVARRMRGRSDRQDVIFYSQLFRESCEALADHWSRRGNRWPR